jgi:hypothetical protein
MPNLDKCQPQVANALRKDGWTVIEKASPIRYERIFVLADLSATRQHNGTVEQLIIVEVKCFSDSRVYLDELYRAIGQYLIYRSALRVRDGTETLYLAVPTHAHIELFQRRVVRDTIREAGIRLLVVDLDREEIVQWNP